MTTDRAVLSLMIVSSSPFSTAIGPHGLKEARRSHSPRVFVEGVTDANVDAFRRAVDDLPDGDLAELHRHMMETDDFAERDYLLATIDEHREKRLQLGAAGRLM